MEIELHGVLGEPGGEPAGLRISLHRTDPDDLPIVDTHLLLRGRTLSLSVATYPEELERAAAELPALVEGQQGSVRILEYDHAFFLLEVHSLPDDPDLVSISGESHLPDPGPESWSVIEGLPVRGREVARWFCVAFGPMLIPRAHLRDLADLVARFVDPDNPAPVGLRGYRRRRRDDAILPVPPGESGPTAPRTRSAPRPESIQYALSILEEALAIARAAPHRPRSGLLAEIAFVLARLDPERAVELVTKEAHLTSKARAGAVGVIATEAVDVPLARIEQWLESAGARDRLLSHTVRTLAEDDPRRVLEMARTAVDVYQRTGLLWQAARLAAEPYRQQARDELLQTVLEVAADAPHFGGRSLGWVVEWLAELDPPAAVALLRDLPMSEERGRALEAAAEQFVKRAPHLLSELLALARANSTSDREAELGALIGPLSKVDPHQALAVAREIADPSERLYALTALFPSLTAVDPAQAWEVLVQIVALAAGTPDGGWWFFRSETLALIAARLPERVEELIVLLEQGPLKELYLTNRLLRHLAQHDRDRAVQIVPRLPAQEQWPAALVVVEGAARSHPEWALETGLQLTAGHRRAAEEIAYAFAEVGARWALEFARRNGDGRVAITAARHARWYALDDPPAARELAELALQAQQAIEAAPDAEAGRGACSAGCCYAQPPEEPRADLAVLLALADPDRAMEVARTLETPESQVATMLDIAERVMGVEAR
jgi:hypothetical protein